MEEITCDHPSAWIKQQTVFASFVRLAMYLVELTYRRIGRSRVLYRVEGGNFASVKNVIAKRQQDFLRQEFLPIPHVPKHSDETPLEIVPTPTVKLPVRYITANYVRTQ